MAWFQRCWWDTCTEEKRLARDDRQRAAGEGRRPELNPRDQILLTVIWPRHNPRQPVLGLPVWGEPNGGLALHIAYAAGAGTGWLDTMLLPDLVKKRQRSLDDLLGAMPDLVVVIDSFEQKIQRQRGAEAQKPYYSGKKKAHTMKSHD